MYLDLEIKKKILKKSNIEYVPENQNYKYKIVCSECAQVYYRQRLQKNFIKKFRCGKCNGKLRLEE